MITRAPGPGLDPDSASYLGAAESFAAGRGLQIPMAAWNSPTPVGDLAHFPPGFPIAIAATVRVGAAAPQGARVLNAIADAITVSFATWLVATAAGLVPGIGVGVALLVARPLVLVHLSVLSEPLFLCMLVLVVCALVRRWHPLVSGTLAALASLIRYAGISATAAVCLWELFAPGSFRKRITNAVIAAVPTIVLDGAWVLSRHAARGTPEIRHFSIYGHLGDTFMQGLRTIAAWLLPTTEGAGTARLIIGMVVAAILVAIIARADWRSGALLRACALLLLCYIGVLVASRLFADPGIPFDERILAPLVLIVTMMFGAAVATGWTRRGLLLRGVLGVAFGAWLVASALASDDEAEWATSNGSDFAGEDWRTSGVLAWARANAGNRAIYSNWPEAVYFYLHRPAWEVPGTSDPRVLHAFGDTLRARNGLIIAFNESSPDAVPTDTLSAALQLRVVTRQHDGTVFATAR